MKQQKSENVGFSQVATSAETAESENHKTVKYSRRQKVQTGTQERNSTSNRRNLLRSYKITGTWTHKPPPFFLLLPLVGQHRLVRGRRWQAVCWLQLTATKKVHFGCISAQLSAVKKLFKVKANQRRSVWWEKLFSTVPCLWRRTWHSRQKETMETGMESILYVSLLTHD